MAQARIFVISDTHFAHENMYKFRDEKGKKVRPGWASPRTADPMMIRRWNATVRPEDHVYHLGDVALGPGGLFLVKELNGHKRLVLGNHDPYSVKGMRALLEVGFEKIYSARFIDGFLLTHIPVHERSLGGKINVHGHIHQVPAYDDRYRNVCVEQIDYRPVLLNSLL